VSGVIASDGTYSDRVLVSWSLPPSFITSGIDGYHIYRKSTAPGANFTLLASVANSAISYSDFATEPSPAQYIYSVRPYQGVLEAAERADQGYRKRAIASISATDGTMLDSTRITWSAVTGATSYTVYRAGTQIATVTTTTYYDLAGNRGASYLYCVKVNGSGFSSADTACDTGGKFSAAPVVTASEGTYTDRVDLGWTYTSSYETGMRIIRHDLNANTFQTLATGLAATPNTYSDYTAVQGNIYEYCVEAYNASVAAKGCDPIGWRSGDGNIDGSVLTQGSSAPSAGVFVRTDVPTARALTFDGNGDYVDIPGISLNSGSFTIEFWAERTGIGSGNWAFGQGTSLHDQGLTLGFRSDNGPVFSFFNDELVGPPDTSLSWHHWAATYNRSTGARQLFRDGELYASDIAAGTYAGVGNVKIGQTPSGFFNGKLDEVRIWRIVRTQDEILRDGGRLLSDTTNLLGYYPMDIAAGSIIPDYSRHGKHGTLVNAVSVANDVAPVYNGDLTDAEGKYLITRIAHVGGQQFTVRPWKISPSKPSSIIRTISPGDTVSAVHSFTPTSTGITLDVTPPSVHQINFTDNTSFSVSGVIRYLDLSNQSATGVCFAKDVTFEVNGVTSGVATDDQGRYAISRAPGNYKITPVKDGHVFFPDSFSVNPLNQNLVNIDFEDQTRAKLTLRASGGCNTSLGTVKLLLESVNLCFQETVAVNGTTTLDVPPLNYNVRVVKVSTGNLDQDLAIQKYFNERGTKSVDLSVLKNGSGLFADTLEFIYRAPIAIEIAGFPAPQSLTLPPPEGGSINVPVLNTLNNIDLTISVFERYINGTDTSKCPVSRGVVKIHNDITGDSPEDSLQLDSLGQARYHLIPGLPNIASGGAHPFQKRFEAVASVDGQFPSTEQWAIVLGEHPRTATFTTVTPELPMMVLHDPPGDESSSFIEQGHDACTTWSMAFEEAAGIGIENTAFFGTKLLLIEGLGLEVGEETEVIAELTRSLKVTQSLKKGYENELCVGVDEKFSTSSGDVVTGPRGDVFVGAAINLIYALTDVIKLNGSSVVRDTNLAIAATGFATKYIYSENFIRYTLLPNLETIKSLKAGEGDKHGVDSIQNSITVWKQVLQQNITDKANAEFIENKSFDAGPTVSYSKTETRSVTQTLEFGLEIEAEVAAKLGLKVSGTGAEAKVTAAVKLNTGGSTSEETRTSTTVGYDLGDNDAGDFFSVDIKRDKHYGTIAFDLKGGATSCPWEPWYVDPDANSAPRTQRRDLPKLTVSPGERNNVDPEGTASFTLSLTNLSESGELRIYKIEPEQSSNPDGAIMKINGEPNAVFVIDPATTQQSILTVKRGPEAYVYNNLRVLVYSQCDFDVFANGGPLYNIDTATVTVRFQQPCSDIRIAVPAEGWILNRAAGNTMEVAMAGFDLANPDLGEIALQYARETDAIWTNVPQATFTKQSDGSWKTQDGIPVTLTGNSYSFTWVVPYGLPDGAYKLRAVTRCTTLGNFYSATVHGYVDRTAPLVFGHPSPSDGILSDGDDIKVEFSEPIDCAALTSDRFQMRDAISGEIVPVDFLCNFNQTQVVFTPRGLSLNDMRGRTYQMSIAGPVFINNVERGVRDLYGNVMRKGASWAFFVGDSGLKWQSPVASTNLNSGDAGTINTSILNSGSQQAFFVIDSLPPWLTATPPSGSVPAGGSLPITLTINNTLPVGETDGLIFVRTAQVLPVARVPLTVTVGVTSGAAPLEWSPATLVSAVQAGQSGILYASLSNLGSDSAVFDIGDHPDWLTITPMHDTIPARSSRSLAFTVSNTLPLGTVTATINAVTSNGKMALPVLVTINKTGDDQGGAITQTVGFGKGWSLFSLSVDVSGRPIDSVLTSLRDSGTTGDMIFGPGGSSQFSSVTNKWTGDIATLTPGRSYLLHRANGGGLAAAGIPVNPSMPIPLASGWNFVGYLPVSTIGASQALASLGPTGSVGDVIKDVSGSLIYFPADSTWYGTLTQLEPGMGYRLRRANAGTLTYVNGGSMAPRTKGAIMKPASIADSVYQIDGSQYAYSMTVAASLAIGSGIAGGPHDLILAYAGSELRGTAPFVSVGSLGQYRDIITIHSNSPGGETITFRLATDSNSTTQALNTDPPVTFSADTVLGTIDAPVIMRLSSTTGVHDPIRDLPGSYALYSNYPNPFNPATVIRYALPVPSRVELRVFDVLGREVAALVSGDQSAGYKSITWDAGHLASGIYFCRLEAVGIADHSKTFTQVRKLMLMK
jgi:hypothetical protein